jgi:leader peptidase (prepilin peptidase)/N-methyltransferase
MESTPVSLHILLPVLAGLLGLVIGSYLNVVIHRLPLGISTVLPRSRCPACGAAIRPRDNVPVVSYLLLRGRCRACAAPISWQYPAIEAATALLFAACALRFGPAPAAAVAALFCALMVVLAAIDVEHFLLPDRLTLPGLAAGLLLAPRALGIGFWDAFWGAVAGGGLLLLLWGGWYLLRREEGMGLGDVKMLALIGAFLGAKGVLVALFFAALSGALVGLALMWRRGLGLKAKLPFGAFLALGGVVSLFAGRPLADWYLGLL